MDAAHSYYHRCTYEKRRKKKIYMKTVAAGKKKKTKNIKKKGILLVSLSALEVHLVGAVFPHTFT